MTPARDTQRVPPVKFTGKPDAGDPLVRFDEGEGNPLPTLLSKNSSMSVPVNRLPGFAEGKHECPRIRIP